MGLIILIVLIVLLFGGGIGYHSGWYGGGPTPYGYGGFGIVGLVLFVWVLLILFRGGP